MEPIKFTYHKAIFIPSMKRKQMESCYEMGDVGVLGTELGSHKFQAQALPLSHTLSLKFFL
jgi:hypothetical protein